MTKTMKTQFAEKFALINKNFNEVFQELFGGGKAELVLEDEENIDDDILEKEVDNKKEEEIKTTEDLKRKYEEAIVIIDKSGMGHVDFTDEERKKT